MPTSESSPIRAVLWDLDGTLYRQRPLRRRMLLELGKASLCQSPLESLRLMRWLGCYRKVREELRELGHCDESLDEVQYRVPAERLGIAPEALRERVREWMLERPLPFLLAARYAGLVDVLKRLRKEGVELGVFSDYPVQAKLKALGLSDFFSVQLAATDRSINAFKPHARGFLVGCKALGFEPDEVVYVGDRDEVDGAGAAAAGMRCLVLDAERTGQQYVHDFEEIGRRLGV